MATLSKHVLGMPKGSLADSISFSSWRGKAVIHSLPTTVNNPNTLKQQAVRNKFRLLGETLVPLAEVINAGWKAFQNSGRKAVDAQNMYMKYHLTEVEDIFIGEYPDYTAIDPTKLELSRGSYQGLLSAEYNVGAMDFKPTYQDDQPENDITYAVLYESDLNRAVYATGTVEQGDITLAKPDSFGENTHLFAFTTNAAGDKASVCLYLGKV